MAIVVHRDQWHKQCLSWVHRMKTVIIVFFAVAGAFFAGCEDSSAPDDFNNPAPASALSVIPSYITLGPTNTYAVFEARGGTPPYTWSIGDTSLGTIPATTAHLITYTRVASKYGANAISLKDANGWMSTAAIWQPDTTNSTRRGL